MILNMENKQIKIGTTKKQYIYICLNIYFHSILTLVSWKIWI